MINKINKGVIYFDNKSILEALTNHFDPLLTKNYMFSLGAKSNGDIYAIATTLIDQKPTPETLIDQKPTPNLLQKLL
jgi:hypothetical protein